MDYLNNLPILSSRFYKETFVAFFDIRGFKDEIYRNQTIELMNETYNRMVGLQTLIKALDKAQRETKSGAASVCSFAFSDTLMFYVQVSEEKQKKPSASILNLIAAKVFEHCLIHEIPIKGAIAHGDMCIDSLNNIFFGLPLIDAYQLEESVQFYGVVLHHSAEKKMIELNLNSSRTVKYMERPIPTEKGNVFHQIVLPQKLEAAKIIEYLKKLRLKSSGAVRKYIDNSIDIYQIDAKQ